MQDDNSYLKNRISSAILWTMRLNILKSTIYKYFKIVNESQIYISKCISEFTFL